MSRKTVPVAYLLALVNHMSATHYRVETRQGAQVLLEAALHQSKNYRGFRYLEACELPDNTQPGIVRTCGVVTFPDETRRFYFVAPELKDEYDAYERQLKS